MRKPAPELAASRSEDPAVLSEAAARPRLPLATPVMPWLQSPVVVLLVSLAVTLLYGSQTRAKAFPEITDSSQPTSAATVHTIAKLQPTNQVPPQTIAASSTDDDHITSQIAVTTSNPETTTVHTTVKTLTTTSLVTKNSTPSTSPIIHTLVTTLTTPNTSRTTAIVTEATIGPSADPRSHTLTPPAHTTGISPLTVNHTTGKTTQPSNQTTLPATLSTSPHNSTTSQRPAQSTPAPDTTTATRNTMQTTSQRPTQSTPAPDTTTATHTTTQTTSSTTTTPRPTLAPQPSTAKTGTYQVLNGSRLCIKAEMGIQLTVQDMESVFSRQRYFNIDPNTTQASGNCGSQESNLLLNFQGGFVNLTLTKDENSYYISEVRAYLTVSNPEKIYQGMKSAVMMFETVVGHSFKCVSEQSVQLSAHLQLKTMNVQLQAFDFEDDHFGNADECFSDRNRRQIPVAVGLSITGLLIILLTACLVARKRPNRGYERM